MERKRYNAEFKAKVALNALKEDRMLAELSSAYGVHTSMIKRRRNELLEKVHTAFSGADAIEKEESESLIHRACGGTVTRNERRWKCTE